MPLGLDWNRAASALILATTGVLVGTLAGVRPEAAIVASLALCFALIVFADLAAGVVLFTLLTYFELLPEVAGPAVSFTKVAGLALAVSWLAVLATREDAARVDVLREYPFLGATLVLFLAWAGLSISWAEDPAAAVEAFYRLALNGALILIVFTAIRSSKQAIMVLAALALGAVGAAAYGFFLLGIEPTPYGEAVRLTGGDQNPNELASTLVVALVLSLGLLAVLRDSPALRVLMGIAAVIAGAGLVLTVSRAGLISLGVALVAAVVFGGRWRGRVALGAALIGSMTVLYFLTLAPPEARVRVSEAEGGSGRTDIWKVAERMIEANPIAGVGAGNFEVASVHYLLEPGAIERDEFIIDEPKVAHNTPLGITAQLGLVGLALFFALVGSFVWCGVKAIRVFAEADDRRMEILARAQVVALMGFLASLIFASGEFKKQLWLLFAMGPVLLAIARARLAARAEARS